MFAYIKGTVTEIGTDEIIVETGGIGFSVFTSSQDSARTEKCAFYPVMPVGR